MTHCFGEPAEHPEDGSFSKAAADTANDSSTAGAAASAGADIVYSDTLPAQQAIPKIVSVDPHKVCTQSLPLCLHLAVSLMPHDFGPCSACNAHVRPHRPIHQLLVVKLFTFFMHVCCHHNHSPVYDEQMIMLCNRRMTHQQMLMGTRVGRVAYPPGNPTSPWHPSKASHQACTACCVMIC